MTNFRRTIASTLWLASLALITATTAACSSDDDGATPGDETGETESELSGQAIYRDSATDHDGQPRTASAPDDQDVSLEIDVRGTGTLEGLDPQCSLEGAAGQFEGVYAGDLALGDDGVFAQLLTSTTASFETPTGCTIPDLTIAAMTEVIVRARLTATTQNCESFCEAHARAEAEAECGATADAATCRADAEGELTASCTTTCTSETHHIVAETALSADAVAALNAAGITGTTFGDVGVDLVFDRVVDAEGTIVIGASAN
jgi:hypothetical protein